MRAVAKQAIAFLATAFVLTSLFLLPVSASDGVTGIVYSDGYYYYYVDGVMQKGLGLIYYDGYYYYVRTGGNLAANQAYYVQQYDSSASELASNGSKFYNFGPDGKMIFPTYGADSSSDYLFSYDIITTSAKVDHIAYRVDEQNWTPYMYPFKDLGSDTKYAAYYTYVPCVASLPINYSFPGITVYSRRSSSESDEYCYTVNRVFDFDLSLGSYDETKSQVTIRHSVTYSDGTSLSDTLTLKEGVDFTSSCVFVGLYYGYYYNYDSSSEYSSYYAAFLIDGVFTYLTLRNTVDSSYVSSYGYELVFAGTSDEPIEAYTLGFATTYASSPTYGTVGFDSDEFQAGWDVLYGTVYPSDNMRAWINELYESAINQPESDVTLDDVMDVLSGEITDLKDTIHSDLNDIKDSINNPVSTIKPPSVKLPSSSQDKTVNDLNDGQSTINGVIDSVFGNVDDLVNDYLVAPPSNLTDYLMLATVFTSLGNYFLNIPGFDLIVTALTFVFLMWIMGLNLSGIRHARERDQSRAETRQYRSEQRSYWEAQRARWRRK